ncbi:MAG: acetyl-CoA C-acyltransferase [Alphaproteobacteria bacterium]|nr:acetyl-CoA C-acyltransferase [Alphaproteobacteria bacterium]
MSRRVAIVAGCRTPFVKAVTAFKDIAAVDLSAHAVDGLLASADVDPASIHELHWGVVVVNPRLPHIGRETVFRSKLPVTTRGVTYTDNCISGTTAMIALHDAIALGRLESGIAGGVESMSNTPLLYSERMQAALRDAQAEQALGGKVRKLLGLGLADILPQLPGVAEPSTGLSMGQHCELMVKQWKIGRTVQDEIALRSHQRAAAATEDGRLKAEIAPLNGVDHDLIVRKDTSLDKLARLRPVFDPTPTGTITAGSSSPLTDGAAAVLMMSEDKARAEGREPLAFVRDFENVAIDPADGLLMGPGVAVPRLLGRHGLTLDDIDLVEMHEAFGGQVACNLAAWEQGWKEPAIGTVDPARLNVMGSSIAIGHPFAATGARIAGSLANEMARRNARYGLISICAAGAQAVAMLLERDV